MHGRTVARTPLVLLALLMIAAALPWSGRFATAQTAAGTLAYVRADSRDEIRLIEPDGSGDRRLWAHGIPDPHSVYEFRSLAWRSNAAELAFDSTHENWCSINHADIFAIAADGSNYRRITEAPACGALAAYPKGTVGIPVRNSTGNAFVGFVYFQGAPSAQQVSLPASGSATLTFNNVADLGAGDEGLQVAALIEGSNRYIAIGTAVDVQAGGTVTTATMSVFSPFGPWEAHSPTWRRDGSKIGYVLNFNSLRQLSPDPAPLDFGDDLANNQSAMPDFADLLAWGPTATTANQLLYAGNTAFDSEGVYLVTEGSSTAGEQLVSHEVYENIRGLAWLPDGSGFIYAVEELNDIFESVRANLFEYNFATRQRKRITNLSNEFAGQLSVSPNGQQIAFERSTSKESAASDLWVVNRDGSGLRLLARNAAAPAWSSGVLQIPKKVYVPMIRR